MEIYVRYLRENAIELRLLFKELPINVTLVTSRLGKPLATRGMLSGTPDRYTLCRSVPVDGAESSLGTVKSKARTTQVFNQQREFSLKCYGLEESSQSIAIGLPSSCQS